MTHHSGSPTPAETLEEALQIARIQLGPHSASLLGKPHLQSLLLSRFRRGGNLEDSVFAIIFEYGCRDRGQSFGCGDPRIANEFFGSFLSVLHAKGRRLTRGNLERALDSQDLVQSVIGDLLDKPFDFQGRAQFLAYLDQGMRWKVSAARNGSSSQKRLDADPLDLETEPTLDQPSHHSPLSQLANDEQLERLLLGMQRLKPDDREVMEQYLKGRPQAEIAQDIGVTVAALRSRMARILKKIRSMFPESGE